MQKLIIAGDSNELQTNVSLPLREIRAREYIIAAFTGKMPSLIPLATNNASVVKLASYLLKYTKGSQKTLYQYVFGIHRFCDWIDKTPDEIINEAVTNKI